MLVQYICVCSDLAAVQELGAPAAAQAPKGPSGLPRGSCGRFSYTLYIHIYIYIRYTLTYIYIYIYVRYTLALAARRRTRSHYRRLQNQHEHHYRGIQYSLHGYSLQGVFIKTNGYSLHLPLRGYSVFITWGIH